jgi:membrane fusion protein (multidrug efflux system)
VTVTAATARLQSWDRRLTAVGTLEAVQGVDVTNSLGGKVVSIEFESGDWVQAGDILLRQDTSSEKAELRSTQADLQQAERELSRAKELLQQRAISEEEYEQKQTTVTTLKAQGAAQQTSIDKKQIVAPFSGMLGIRRTDLGAFLTPGTPIVTLQQIHPILVNFDLPEQQAGTVRAGQSVAIAVAAFPNQHFEGKITAVNPLIAETTRSLSAQATISNQDMLLRPGMFAEVTLFLNDSREVVTVPETAIAFNAYGTSVFLIRKSDASVDAEHNSAKVNGSRPESQQASLVAKEVFVETGERRDLEIEVTNGVSPGERVVTAGQLKLDDGTPISITDEDPLRDVAPRPSEP